MTKGKNYHTFLWLKLKILHKEEWLVDGGLLPRQEKLTLNKNGTKPFEEQVCAKNTDPPPHSSDLLEIDTWPWTHSQMSWVFHYERRWQTASSRCHWPALPDSCSVWERESDTMLSAFCFKTLTHQPCAAVPLSAHWTLASSQQLLGFVDSLAHNIALSQEA